MRLTCPRTRHRGEAIWTLPADRTKTTNALRVPFSALARFIIKEVIEHGIGGADGKCDALRDLRYARKAGYAF